MEPYQMSELIGRVWDRWGLLSSKQRTKLRRIDSELYDTLSRMHSQVTRDLADAWVNLNRRER